MRREWTIWLGFTAVVLVAVVFVLSRDDQDSSKLSAGTSVPTTVVVPSTVATTRPPPTTPPSTVSTSTTVAPTTAAPTTRVTTPATNPGTVATTEPPATAPPPTAPPDTEPPLRASFGVGTYRINIDLPPGIYRTEGRGAYCFWARLSSVTATPTPADVIASDYTGGAPATVSILATDAAFTTSGCDIWLSV